MKVVDMHCDTIRLIWNAEKEGKPISLLSNDLHIDLQKMLKGDYQLQNFAVFVKEEGEGDPLATALEIIDVYHRQMKENSGLIAPVYCYGDIEKNSAKGKMSSLLTIEEGGVCKGSTYVLRTLYEIGVRMMTLTWNFENEIGYPNTVTQWENYDPSKKYGLKEAGIEIVQEMNRIGMIVDVSHIGDDSFWDVVKYTDRPFVASHSNARALCGHSRNMTDEMIRALSERGGVMGINFWRDFLTTTGEKSTVDDMIRHIKHIRQVGGIGCIGLGTDFDGIEEAPDIDRADKMQMLAQGMEKAGFTTGEIEAVFHDNVLRLYKEILK